MNVGLSSVAVAFLLSFALCGCYEETCTIEVTGNEREYVETRTITGGLIVIRISSPLTNCVKTVGKGFEKHETFYGMVHKPDCKYCTLNREFGTP